jgi:hypothetical protein
MSVLQEDVLQTERRGNKAAVPVNINTVLNQEQSLTLRKIESFGWQLAFIRQPVFEQPIAVVVNPDRTRHAVLEDDGELNMNPDITLRH